MSSSFSTKLDSALKRADSIAMADADSRSYDVNIDSAKDKKGKEIRDMHVPVTASGSADAEKKAAAWMKNNGFTDVKTGSIARSGKDQ